MRLEHDIIGEIEAEVRDISATGIFVTCKNLADKISVGDAFAVKAKINFAPENDTPSQLKVVRLAKDGVGFAYE